VTLRGTPQQRLKHLYVVTRPDVGRRWYGACTDQHGLISRIKPQHALEIFRINIRDEVGEEARTPFRADEAALLVGTGIGQGAQITRCAQAACGEGGGTLRPEHVGQWARAVAVGTGEAANEAARQPGVTKERHQCLGIECPAWLTKMCLEKADGNAQPRVETIIDQKAWKESRQVVCRRASGSLTKILEAKRHTILHDEVLRTANTFCGGAVLR
jgi:hypothetical protein